jgi:mannitol/fructose-specific phosphotransferase system IIA component (Ntr-type)
MPLQYITGTAPFRYLEVEVAPGVLIPRPETEVLVSEALALLPAAPKPQDGIDRAYLAAMGLAGDDNAADDDAARNVSEPADRDNPKTGISRFSAEELMIVGLDVDTREEAIAQLADAMEKGGFIKNADSLVTAALERESVLSTAMGEGLAFPHVRGVEGGGLTLAMGVSQKGIDWEGEKVNFVFLSAIPVAVSAFYLRLMSGIIQTFSKEANRKSILEAADSAALWKALQKATRITVK